MHLYTETKIENRHIYNLFSFYKMLWVQNYVTFPHMRIYYELYRYK